MINRKCGRKAAALANLSNLLSRTGQSNYILSEVYHAMERLGFLSI